MLNPRLKADILALRNLLATPTVVLGIEQIATENGIPAKIVAGLIPVTVGLAVILLGDILSPTTPAVVANQVASQVPAVVGAVEKAAGQ